MYNGFTRSEMDHVIVNHGKQKPTQSEEEIIKGVAVIP